MSDLIKRHRDVIIGFDTEVIAERAQGLWVHTPEGRKYADFACGTAVVNLGHNHPAVVAAAHAQMISRHNDHHAECEGSALRGAAGWSSCGLPM